MAIDYFRREHFFLSNMFPFENGISTPDGEVVHTAEQLYLPPRFMQQAARQVIQQADDGFSAKALTKALTRSKSPTWPNWRSVQVPLMRDCVMVKFAANPDIASQLLDTGEEELIEGNERGDTFWGVVPPPSKQGRESIGENMLGKILMDTRAQLAEPGFTVDIDAIVARIFSRPQEAAGLTSI